MTEKTSVRDLIELPGPFTFKIIVKPDLVPQSRIIEVAASSLARALDGHRLSSRASAKANYKAYTLEIHILEFEEIENLYRAYRRIDGVVMVL